MTSSVFFVTSSVFFCSLDEEFEAGRSKLAKLRERIRRAKGVVQVRQSSKDFSLYLLIQVGLDIRSPLIHGFAHSWANFEQYFNV